MIRTWNSILKQYGQELTLRRQDGETRIRAFFQPVDEKTPGIKPTALGMAPAGKYLYLGPPEEDLSETEELEWNGRFFRVLRHRDYWLGNEMVYRWAICEEMDAPASEAAIC